MPELSEVKDIRDVISSYETRIESTECLLDAIQLILGGFHESVLETREERERVKAQLRDMLARNQHLRRKDFDTMMQGIVAAQQQREEEVRKSLKTYFNDQRLMAQTLRERLRRLRESLTRGDLERVREFQSLTKEILDRQERRKQEGAAKLEEFRKQQRDLSLRLRELLAEGKDLRIKNFKVMLKEFKAQGENRALLGKKRRDEVARTLNGLKNERLKGPCSTRPANTHAHTSERKMLRATASHN